VTGQDRAEAVAMPAADCGNESVAAIRRLRRVVEILSEHDDPSAAWFVAKLHEYEGSIKAGHRLDEILDLVSRQGCRSWYEIEELQHRNYWLRVVAERHFPNRSVTKQASEISAAISLFEGGADWKRVKLLAALPAEWRDTARECWFAILKCGKAPKERTIRDILSR